MKAAGAGRAGLVVIPMLSASLVPSGPVIPSERSESRDLHVQITAQWISRGARGARGERLTRRTATGRDLGPSTTPCNVGEQDFLGLGARSVHPISGSQSWAVAIRRLDADPKSLGRFLQEEPCAGPRSHWAGRSPRVVPPRAPRAPREIPCATKPEMKNGPGTPKRPEAVHQLTNSPTHQLTDTAHTTAEV